MQVTRHTHTHTLEGNHAGNPWSMPKLNQYYNLLSFAMITRQVVLNRIRFSRESQMLK